MKMVEIFPNEKITLWVKGKLLIMSNFSFTASAFKRLGQQTHKNKGLFGKGLKLRIVWQRVKAKQCWKSMHRNST